jgi:hypothetical protein
MAQSSEEKGRVASAATSVEHWTDYLTGDRHEWRLRLADVPGRVAFVDFRKADMG